MTGKLKYIALGLLGIFAILATMVIYRMYFMFNSDKIKSYAEEQANATDDANKAYKLIIESVQFILKSQDLTSQVKMLAEIDGIEKEKALVLTALNQCYANGFIIKPVQMGVTIENLEG